MEIFDLSAYSYIRQAINPDRREPGRAQRLCFYRPEPQIHLIDTLSGYTNGRAYGSINLLKNIRTKRVIHPSGPTDLYKYKKKKYFLSATQFF